MWALLQSVLMLVMVMLVSAELLLFIKLSLNIQTRQSDLQVSRI